MSRYPIPDTGISIVYQPENCAPVVDIVIIHGLQGHPFRTWAYSKDRGMATSPAASQSSKGQIGPLKRLFRRLTSEKVAPTSSSVELPTVFWPGDLLPGECPDSRILVYGYDTKVTEFTAGSSTRNSIISHGQDLLRSLARVRPLNRPLIFVAHSVGGILVKEMLAMSSVSIENKLLNVVKSTAAIIFLGTPHRGSLDLAAQGGWLQKAASALQPNPAVLDTLGLNMTDLERTQEAFSRLWHKYDFRVKTFQEGLGLTGINSGNLGNKVVPGYSSLIGDPREYAETLQANHMEMGRFTGIDDTNYRKVTGEIRLVYISLRELNAAKVDPSTVELTEAELACLRSLRFPGMDTCLHSIGEPAHGTAQWLFQHKAYQDWFQCRNQDKHSGLLWLKGKPGVGKSTLMKQAFLQVSAGRVKSDYRTAAFFFRRVGTDLEHSPLGLFRSLLYQLLPNYPQHLHRLSQLWADRISNRSEDSEIVVWEEAELRSFFYSAFTQRSNQRAIIFIDALDECDSGSIRLQADFWRGITKAASAADAKLNICFSSRQIPSITGSDCLEIIVEHHNNHDIAMYVDQTFKRHIAAKEPQWYVLRDKVLVRSDGVFLWVVLVVEYLLRKLDHEMNLQDLLKEVDDVPAGLESLSSQMFPHMELPQLSLSSDPQHESQFREMESPGTHQPNQIRQQIRNAATEDLYPTQAGPSTDSGFASATHTRFRQMHPNHGEDIAQSTGGPQSRLSTDEGYESTANNPFKHMGRALSVATSLPPYEKETTISKLSNDLFAKVFPEGSNNQVMERISAILPQLLEAFADKVGYEARAPWHLQVMYYVQKYQSEIVRGFENICFQEAAASEQSSDDGSPLRNTDDNMPLDEKMRRYWDHSQDDASPYTAEGNADEENDDSMEQNSNPSELLKYLDFVFTLPAYDWLLAALRKEFLLTQERNSMEIIRNEVIRCLPPQRVSKWTRPEAFKAILEINWNPLAFVKDQGYREDPGDAIERAITLTGAAKDAQALTCAQYLCQTWPLAGEPTIQLLKAVARGKEGEIHTCKLPDDTRLRAWVQKPQFMVEIMGTAYSVAETAEEFAWLGAALRSSPDEVGVAYCEPVISEPFILDIPTSGDPHQAKGMSPEPKIYGAINFSVRRIVDQPKPVNGQCWFGLFRNPVIVKGYPILRRAERQNGLEIPLSIMAELAQAARATTFDRKLFVKGFCDMLIPTKRVEDMVIWHTIFNKDGSHISYLDPRISDVPGAHSDNIVEFSLDKYRHVIGWCSDTKSHVGAPDANYTIEWSGLDIPHKGCRFENVLVSSGKLINSAEKAAIGRKDKPERHPRDLYLTQIMEIAQKYVVLYDVEDRRAWLVDGASALLHLVRTSLRRSQTDDFKHLFLFKPESMKEASKTYTAKAASIAVLTSEINKRLKLYDPSIHLKDKVEGIYHILEQIFDYQDKTYGEGDAPRQQLEGFDFMNVATAKDRFKPRVAVLPAKGRGWVDFIRAIHAITLFGDGFGELIRPADTTRPCTFWSQVPVGEDYLTISVSDIKRILNTDGSKRVKPWRLIDNLHWHNPGHMFEDCQCGNEASKGHSDRVQVLLPASFIRLQRKSFNSPPELQDGGAVIFGHSSKYPLNWGAHGDPTEGVALSLEQYDSPFQELGIISNLASSTVGESGYIASSISLQSRSEGLSVESPPDPEDIVLKSTPASPINSALTQNASDGVFSNRQGKMVSENSNWDRLPEIPAPITPLSGPVVAQSRNSRPPLRASPTRQGSLPRSGDLMGGRPLIPSSTVTGCGEHLLSNSKASNVAPNEEIDEDVSVIGFSANNLSTDISFNGKKVLDVPEESKANADIFYKSFKQFLDNFITPKMANRRGGRRRVKIALLDTGIDKEDIYLDGALGEVKKRRGEQGFSGNEERNPIKKYWPTKEVIKDECGHGTNLAYLLLTYSPEADLYIAKVAKDEKAADPVAIAGAIDWAAGEEVDIITMSFGSTLNNGDMMNAISRAKKTQGRTPLLFASASNNGLIEERTYPARESGVICVHTLDGAGGRSNLNPPRWPAEVNFATFGCCVPLNWKSGLEYKSGTSYATPVLAAVVANLLDWLDYFKEMGKLESHEYEALRTETHLRRIFAKHLSEKQDDLQFIAPWYLFREKQFLATTEKNVKAQIPHRQEMERDILGILRHELPAYRPPTTSLAGN